MSDGDTPSPRANPSTSPSGRILISSKGANPGALLSPQAGARWQASWWPCCSADLGCPKVRPWLEAALQVNVLRSALADSRADRSEGTSRRVDTANHTAANTPFVAAAAFPALLPALGRPGPFTRRFQSRFRLFLKS